MVYYSKWMLEDEFGGAGSFEVDNIEGETAMRPR
jgi:hypothetical protein